MSNPAAHGGARKGAGRPKKTESLTEQIVVRLTPRQREIFKQRGGPEWLRKLLSKANQEKGHAE